MGVVDVVAGAVGEHGVYEVGLDLGGRGLLPYEAPGVAGRRLVLEIPVDAPGQRGHVGIDQRRRGRDGVRLATTSDDDPVLGLYAEDLNYGHAPTLPRLGAQRAPMAKRA